MALEAGTKLGHYEVVSSLGAGGMGEVHRAKDTKLGREVAIKLLLDEVSTDPERLARFEREARVLASLNHPNIATLYGFEKEGDTSFLVMELVEGETLADRIARGPVPVDEALPLFLQIAEGLEAAHEQGVIHRDLKPANIKISVDGTVKILDFGLAKALASEDTGSDDVSASMSPTLTLAATMRGDILGTAAYMSPEQARGHTTDRRSDIWSYGATFVEALTGERLFSETTTADTIGAVLRAEIDLIDLPAETPRRVVELLLRCLCRDPKDRLQAIGEARIALTTCLEGREGEQSGSHAEAATRRPAALAIFILVIAASVLGAAGTWLVVSTNDFAAEAPVVRLELDLPGVEKVALFYGRSLAISADGSVVAITVDRPDPSAMGATSNEGLRLFRRDLDGREAVPIPGSERGESPVLSPDGSEVAFVRGRELMRLPIEGGVPISICELQGEIYGLDWGEDNTIAFASEQGIWQVEARGGEPQQIVLLDAGQLARSPQLLRGGSAVLYSLRPAGAVWDESQVVVKQLVEPKGEVLFTGGVDARVLPSGHIVYAQDEMLWARTFDAATLVAGDEAIPTGDVVSRDLYRNYDFGNGEAHFAVSATGILVYVKGGIDPFGQHGLFWHEGDQVSMLGAGPGLDEARISPDGLSVVTEVETEDGFEVRICDLERCDWSELDPDGADPVWSRDSLWVYFAVNPTNSGGRAAGLYRRRANFSGAPELLLASGGHLQTPESMTPDGSVAYTGLPLGGSSGPGNLAENEKRAWILLPDRDEARLLLDEPAMVAQLHGSGRWFAYVTPPQEGLYLREVLENGDTGRRITVDTLGYEPVWSPDGTRLYYRRDTRLMAASFQEGDGTFGTARAVLEGFRTAGITNDRSNYDVAADGRVLAPRLVGEQPAAAPIRAVVNWSQDLKRLLPTE